MKDYKELPDGRKVYDFAGVRSRMTGGNAEVVMIIGAKNAGKTFGARLECINEYLKDNKRRFCEISRTRDEMADVAAGYFDRIVSEGIYPGYQFMTDKNCMYIAPICPEDEKPQWQVMGYFACLSMFQRTKRRSNFVDVTNVIFDEFIIDARDRYHGYLPDEFGIFSNVLNSIFRPFPNDGIRRNVFMLANACDMTCPYLRHFGIDKPPEFGFTFYNKKRVLLHYVAPWDVDAIKLQTIVGRLMDGYDDSQIFDNIFDTGDTSTIKQKTSAAKFAFGFIFKKARIGVWSDLDAATWYITGRIPDGERNVYALTKSDGTINYGIVRRNSPLMRMLCEMFYAGGLRYESFAVRELFFTVLDYFGIK